MAKTFKIHPAIGFARVGTSPEVYLEPEIPGTFARPDDKKYRDSSGRLKRQAARFWIFEYDSANPTAAPKEVSVGGAGPVRIEWTVHLANKKAVWFAFEGITGEGPGGYPAGHPLRNPTITDTVTRKKQLIIDPFARTLNADGTMKMHEIAKGTSLTPANETWPPTFTGGKKIESLGTLYADAQGRLTVAGGYGVSGTTGTIPASGDLDYANNDGWFDDVSDGSVTAKLVFSDGTTAEAAPAWVIVGPPDYAPPIENLVTVHDLLFDLGLRSFGTDITIFKSDSGGFQTTFKPSFTRDVYPILRRALEYQWVIDAAAPHAGSARFTLGPLAAAPAAGETTATNPREKIFRRMRDPDNLMSPPPKNMPVLHNDGIDGAPPESRRFTVTRYQYFVLKQWSAGTFAADWPGSPPAPATTVTAAGLDRAAGDAACGGAFFPGMEGSWILRDPRVYMTPFNFRFTHLAAEGPTGLTPGDAGKRMALPWQADFHDCASNWWPAQRPNQVLVGAAKLDWLRGVTSHVHLVDVWAQLGIVQPDPTDTTRFIEAERTLP